MSGFVVDDPSVMERSMKCASTPGAALALVSARGVPLSLELCAATPCAQSKCSSCAHRAARCLFLRQTNKAWLSPADYADLSAGKPSLYIEYCRYVFLVECVPVQIPQRAACPPPALPRTHTHTRTTPHPAQPVHARRPGSAAHG
eukprot:SAG22_NODE_336_length_12071_cov_10.875125_4_plen_145_part_00